MCVSSPPLLVRLRLHSTAFYTIHTPESRFARYVAEDFRGYAPCICRRFHAQHPALGETGGAVVGPSFHAAGWRYAVMSPLCQVPVGMHGRGPLYLASYRGREHLCSANSAAYCVWRLAGCQRRCHGRYYRPGPAYISTWARVWGTRIFLSTYPVSGTVQRQIFAPGCATYCTISTTSFLPHSLTLLLVTPGGLSATEEHLLSLSDGGRESYIVTGWASCWGFSNI